MNVIAPRISARFAPVYWEPMVGSSERITALIAIEPELGVSGLIPAVHLILPLRRLKSMFGAGRGSSAFGILNDVAEFMTSRLAAGLPLEDLDAPYSGFSIGRARAIRAFSEGQLLSGAMQMVSALGNVDALLDDGIDASRSTVTTSGFLKLVQSAFSNDNKDKRNRFFKDFHDGPKKITLDYAHGRFLVQFTSSPSTIGQAPYMNREAESKILELITARDFVGQKSEAILIVNRQQILQAGEKVERAAKSARETFKWLAAHHRVAHVEVGSKNEAVRALEALSETYA